MFSIIRHDELKAMIDRNDAMVIVDVLSPESYLKHHLPGAINIPLHEGDFKALTEKMIPDKSVPIIVYCANRECQASPTAAKKLAKMGYRSVSDYENGLKEWRELGYELGG